MLLNLLVGSEIQYARVMHSTHLYKRWDRDLSDEIVQSELTSFDSEPFHCSKRFR
jgi:hypothetical protein